MQFNVDKKGVVPSMSYLLRNLSEALPYDSKAMSSLFVFLALSVQHISVTLVMTELQYLMSLTKALWTQKVNNLIRIIHFNPVHTCH